MGDSGRQARGQAVVGEVGGQERHDLGHLPVLDAEDVEPTRYVSAGVVVPQVGAECELAVLASFYRRCAERGFAVYAEF